MNDTEREDWVRNDEGLYNMWRRSRLSMRAFVKKKNRKFIDEIIEAVSSGTKSAHYLEYDDLPAWMRKNQN